MAGRTAPRDPRPHRTAFREEVDRMLNVENMSDMYGDPGLMTLKQFRTHRGYEPDTEVEESKLHQAWCSAEWKDQRTWTGAVWSLRDRAMPKMQTARDMRDARYRPVVSLTQPEYDRRYAEASGGKVRAMPKVLVEPKEFKTVRSESDEPA